MSVLDPHTSGGIIRSASRAEDELNAVVNTRLRAFLPILVCVYVATAATAVFLSPAGSAWPAGYVAYFRARPEIAIMLVALSSVSFVFSS